MLEYTYKEVKTMRQKVFILMVFSLLSFFAFTGISAQEYPYTLPVQEITATDSTEAPVAEVFSYELSSDYGYFPFNDDAEPVYFSAEYPTYYCPTYSYYYPSYYWGYSSYWSSPWWWGFGIGLSWGYGGGWYGYPYGYGYGWWYPYHDHHDWHGDGWHGNGGHNWGHHGNPHPQPSHIDNHQSPRGNPYAIHNNGTRSWSNQNWSIHENTYHPTPVIPTAPRIQPHPYNYNNKTVPPSIQNHNRQTPPTYNQNGGRYYTPPTRAYEQPRYGGSTQMYPSPSHPYSAPSRSYSTPSHSYSAPAHSYSAPSYSGGHGG